MSFRTYRQLGRISNLPTVWSNVLAGMVLAGGALSPGLLPAPLLACSLFYVGGMFLNDAFDREIDRRERPERPIPSGRVGAAEVFAVGFGMLVLAWIVLLVHVWVLGYGSARALAAGAALAAAIVLYDAWHKGNPWGPVLMGICRALVYVTAGLAATARPHPALPVGALILLAYLIGLTYVAKQETLARVTSVWPLGFLAAPFLYGAGALGRGATGALLYLGFLAVVLFALRLVVRRRAGDVPRAVITLIAGISLLDALLIARQGDPLAAWTAALGFPLTLLLQRYVRGT